MKWAALRKEPHSPLTSKSMDWFLYDKDLRHERVKYFFESVEKGKFVWLS